MNLFIVGSREYARWDAVIAYVRGLPPDVTIVTGGARGVDAVAEKAAAGRRLSRIVCEPAVDSCAAREDYTAALLARNRRIVSLSDGGVAFWDGKSRGTLYTVDYARKQGKLVVVYGADGERT